MTQFATLKNIFVHYCRRKFTVLVTFALLFALFPISPSFAIDRRVIDVVSVRWSGSEDLPGTVEEVKHQIETVVSPWWKNLTTIEGDNQDRVIEFYSGEVLLNPIATSVKLPCQENYVNWTNMIRVETYKQLGVSNWNSRYLIIVTPDAGCIWSGRALIGDTKSRSGVIVLHNSVDGFIVAHELGHSLGLGHSNLIRCSNGASDGPWTSCSAIEYGGAIDLMSNVSNQTALSTYHQWRMNLLDPNDIYQSWKSESVEINAVDVFGKPRAIFLRDGMSTYWIEYRKESPVNSAGLVIYRTDPPPNSVIQSPNENVNYRELSNEVGIDIWMMNLDAYSYANSKASGSMTLNPEKTTFLHSGNVSISASLRGVNSALVKIDRKVSSTLSSKPNLNSPNSWSSRETPIVESSYVKAIGGISEYEILVNGKERNVSPTEDLNWQPTFLNPFTAPKILKVGDLPEGEYELVLRVRDFAGSWSPWSDAINVKIDRAYPSTGETVKLIDYKTNLVGIELNDFYDKGSGLCLTELLNPEGWRLSKSRARERPVLEVLLGSNIDKLQTFDCLGNGLQTEIATKISIFPADKLRRNGRMTKVKNLPNGSLRCKGSCTLYATVRGHVAPILSSGSVNMTFKGLTTENIEANYLDDRVQLNSRNLGARLTNVKITGKNFTLIGLVSAQVTFSSFMKIDRVLRKEDDSLNDESQKLLDKYGFTADDFSDEWSILPMVGGTTLDDPTLDLCGSNFPSELNRSERRQMVVSKPGSPYLFLSSETVRYRNGLAAREALAEVRSSYANCIKNSGGVERDGSFTKYSFLELPEVISRLIPEENRVIVYAMIGDGADARYLFGIYQYKEEMFTGLYIVRSAESEFSEPELIRWMSVAEKFAERLRSQ